ncbi:MAG: hypothetical protein GY763_04080 [Gammaproteobacteria bacterium]|nr:hypothetical protein [Gammaproteobacteria bacterium]
MSQFPLVHISGTPSERGEQHGEILKSEIAQTIDFYHSIFNLPKAEIFRLAYFFQKIIGDFEPDYVDEIVAIARAANVEPAWVFALNARTEILSRNNVVSNECTAVYFHEQSILGQNWDWGKALESLTVLMNIMQPDGHAIAIMTEPGIIGKIGMNSCGLGVCLNILTLGQALNGLPVHIVLRAILDCKSLSQVESLLAQHSNGKASNIIVADVSGNGFDMEFCGDEYYRLDPVANTLIHTNHYLGDEINSANDPAFFSSYARFNKATEILSSTKEHNLETMLDLLSDDSNQEFPVYRNYVADESVQELGTVGTVVMQLAQQKIHVRKGKGTDAGFFEYQMTESGLRLG